jgi:predicted Zn-dependent protease
MNMRRFLLFTASASILCSCTTTVNAPDVAVKNKVAMKEMAQADLHPEDQASFNVDMAAESAVSEGCVAAWRMALKGDEKGSLARLDELEGKYPKMVTISFMRGQILEKLGKKEEAIKFYRQAVTAKEFSSMHLFKLAEALRTTGKPDQALPYYRRLLDANPDYPPFQLALSRNLLAVDKHSAEAKSLLESVVGSQCDGKTMSEAKALLSEMRSGAHSAR